VTLDGEVVHVHAATLDCPLPPPIPILVAARGPVMLSLAGEIADIAHLASLFMDVRHQRDNVRRVLDGARTAGRDVRELEIDISVTVSVSSDRARARSDARRNAAQTVLWIAGTDAHNAKRRDWQRPPEFDVDEDLIRALTTRWDMWKEPELPAELAAMIDDETLDRFTISGDPEECARRMRELADDLPEVTGFRIKLPRPVKAATYEEYERSIRGMGEVITALRAPVRTAARSA
jgi:alkanesulfonate monooxygenase SsuD/methylene tetrahydromethanopterin reductase-like flavin-dependent oxidoreductase (luciferase family)